MLFYAIVSGVCYVTDERMIALVKKADILSCILEVKFYLHSAGYESKFLS